MKWPARSNLRTAEDAAVRETSEVVDLEVSAGELLGARVDPDTGRRVAYVACDIISGTARVSARDEVAGLAWVVAPDELNVYVPNGFAPVVGEYLTERGLSPLSRRSEPR